jgi:hypothetical protein
LQNIGGRDLWADLQDLDADVALLQEVRPPRAGCARQLVPDEASSWVPAGWEQRQTRLTDNLERFLGLSPEEVEPALGPNWRDLESGVAADYAELLDALLQRARTE